MDGLGRAPRSDRDSELRLQMMELAANLLALLSILATMLVIVLAADAGPTVIAALATAVSVSFRGWLAYRQRHPRDPDGPGHVPTAPIGSGAPRLPGPRRSLDEPAEVTADGAEENSGPSLPD
jgi:hypothetical protein